MSNDALKSALSRAKAAIIALEEELERQPETTTPEAAPPPTQTQECLTYREQLKKRYQINRDKIRRRQQLYYRRPVY